jgi:hypothetical protein
LAGLGELIDEKEKVDVSALGGVHTLNLSNTPVVDVSALGGVHTLNLSNTPVVDVSALGGVHTLITNLSFADYD